MRKLLVLALLVLPTTAWATQPGEVDITGQVGWLFGGTAEYSSYYGSYYYPNTAGSIHINAATSFGGALTFYPKPYYGVEINYTYQGSELINRPYNYPDNKVGNTGTHYVMVHGIREMPTSKSVLPYVMGGMGGVWYNLNSDLSGIGGTQGLFAFDVGLGAKANINEKIAIRLQYRLMIPIQWASGGIYFGSGGAGVTMTGGSAILQNDASLGLTFKLGKSQ